MKSKKFQSHNGAIAAMICLANASARSLFQSHNGAIAAKMAITSTCLTHWFQSHNGAIAACHRCSYCALAQQVSIPQWCDCCHRQRSLDAVSPRFQSHNGAIAAFKFPFTMIVATKFQSHNGAIAALKRWLGGGWMCLVSIPQWCDCC